MSLFHEAMQGGTTVASRSEHVQGAVYNLVKAVANGDPTGPQLLLLQEAMVAWSEGHVAPVGERLADAAAALEDLKI